MQNIDDKFAKRRAFERSIVCTQFVQNTATRPHVALRSVPVVDHRHIFNFIYHAIVAHIKKKNINIINSTEDGKTKMTQIDESLN